MLTPLSARRGQLLSDMDETGSRIYFPVRGLVSSRFVFESDDEMELAIIGANNAVGVVSALDFPSPMRTVCLTEVQGWSAPISAFRTFIHADPARLNIVRDFSHAQIKFTVRLAVCTAMHTAEQRLARWLVIATDLLGAPELRLPQEELASILALRRNHLNPVLNRLRRDGLIEIGRERIAVLDRQALRRRSCECHQVLERAIHHSPAAPATVAS